MKILRSCSENPETIAVPSVLQFTGKTSLLLELRFQNINLGAS